MRSLKIFPAVLLLFLMAGIAPLYAQTATGGMSVKVQQAGGGTTTVNLYSASYALVIGNDDYRAGWPRLSNAVRDAEKVKKALESQGYEVTMLTNLRRTELIQAMREFFIIKGEDPEARLLFWYAGHGHTENNEGFIIPVDGALPETGAQFRLTALPMRDISTFVRLAAAKHVYAVFDACFAGTIFGSSRAAPPKAITQATTRPVRQFLTSGDAFQQVGDDGTFRDLFVRAINGDEDADLNNDGYVTGTELGFYIADRMTNLTEGRQTPRYGKLRDRNFDQGDYVLASYRSAPPATAKRAPQGAATGSQAMELALWQSAERTDTTQSYGEYIKRFPGGMFAGLAGERMRMSDRKEATGRAADLAEAEAKQSAAQQAADQQRQLEHSMFWQSAQKSDSIEAYEAYLSQYPDRTFASLARARISALNKASQRKTQLAALPPQTSEPEPRLPASGGGGGLWHVTAKVKGTTSCSKVPLDFEGDFTVSGNAFQRTFQNSSGKKFTLKGEFRGTSLDIGGSIERKPLFYTVDAWLFSTLLSENSPGSYQKTIMTTRDPLDCGLRVTLSIKRKN